MKLTPKQHEAILSLIEFCDEAGLFMNTLLFDRRTRYAIALVYALGVGKSLRPMTEEDPSPISASTTQSD